MGYSKETERQNKVLGDLLSGKTPEKRIMVGFDKKEEKSGDQIDRLSDIMKEARMPWFCPSCKKVMKKRLDNKMWILYNHCFECQLQIENKMRIAGTYEEWKNENIKKNKLAWINEQRQSIIEWKSQDAPTVFNQVSPDGHTVQKEKWLTDKKELDEKADEALNYLNELEESLQ